MFYIESLKGEKSMADNGAQQTMTGPVCVIYYTVWGGLKEYLINYKNMPHEDSIPVRLRAPF